MKSFLSICFFLLLFSLPFYAQNAVLDQLKKEDKIEYSFYFYPSTLRMLNIQQDTAFNRLVKQIKKLSFYKLGREEEVRTLSAAIMEQEQYEPYLEVDGVGQQVQIMGLESGEEWMTVATIEGETYMTYVEGSINWLEIPKVYERISQDTSTQNGFGILLDYFQESEQRDRGKRERRRKREAERRGELEEKEEEEIIIDIGFRNKKAQTPLKQ